MKEVHKDSAENPDELDLIVLLEKLIAFLKRFAKILITFTLIGMIIGLILFLSAVRRYPSTLVLHSFTLTNLENIQIIGSWKELLKKREYLALSTTLNCTPDVVKNIVSLSAEEIQKLYIQNNPHGFIIKVVVKDPSILDELQKGIIYGLESNDYIKERIAIKRSNLRQLIEKVSIEITKLDSTKLAVENIINNKNVNSSSLMVDVSNINSQIIGLNEKLLSYTEELKFANAVQVLQRFNKFSKPESRKGRLLLTGGAIAGFVIGYIISLLIYVRRKLIDRRKQNTAH